MVENLIFLKYLDCAYPGCLTTERDARRERTGARDQADRSDNAASRASRFEVSAEHHRRNTLFLAESHNSLLPKQLHPFSRNR